MPLRALTTGSSRHDRPNDGDMSNAPIGNTPASVPEPLPGIAILRRVDVVDAELRVLLSGSGRDFLVEAEGQVLAPEIAAEVETLVRTNDFARRPVATGLAGKDFALRIVRTTGPAGSFYTVYSERTLLRRRLAQIVGRYGLTPSETELLRLVAGGYAFAEIGRRLEIGPTALRRQLRELEEKTSCIGRKGLAKLAHGTETSAVSSPLLASFPAANSNTYRARRAGNQPR